MEGSILDELMKIPADAVSATVLGVEMQVIDGKRAQAMLDADPEDKTAHECRMANGHFVCECEEGRLKALYKVQDGD